MDATKEKRIKKFKKKMIENPAAPLKPIVTEGPLILRCDDVTQFTNVQFIQTLKAVMMRLYGGPMADQCRFMVAISLFGKRNPEGSVYPGVPFKDQPRPFFWDVDSFFQRLRWPEVIVASHGLFHVDHSKLSKDALEMSIVGSCRYLRTKIFVPPFNRWNEAVAAVCEENGIHLVRHEEGWRSLEHEPFTPKHRLWYCHHWKYKTPQEFVAALNLQVPSPKRKKSDENDATGDERDTPEWWDKGSYPEHEMTPEEKKKSEGLPKGIDLSKAKPVGNI